MIHLGKRYNIIMCIN